jgi:hypothetical protein
MTRALIALVSLRSLATLFTLQGKPHVSNALNSLATAVTAGLMTGHNVDAYMQEIADKLRDDAPLDDWATINTRIDSEVQKFLSPEIK